MFYLITASLIWCFSFGLIGNTLAGLPRAWVAAVRLFIAMLVFLPFIRRLPVRSTLLLAGTGAVQFGAMYLAYMYSFNYLKSHEVALFTIFTPLYLSLINDVQQRYFNRRNLLTAALSVGGSAVILWSGDSHLNSITGFALVQLSGVFFAAGQLFYRRLFNGDGGLNGTDDRSVMAWLYAGGFFILMPFAAVECMDGFPRITGAQAGTILYLGVLASGAAFFLWNTGCRRVGAGTLAVMNNLKIPAGTLISLLVFGERAEWTSLICGSLLIAAAIFAASRHSPASSGVAGEPRPPQEGKL